MKATQKIKLLKLKIEELKRQNSELIDENKLLKQTIDEIICPPQIIPHRHYDDESNGYQSDAEKRGDPDFA